jgi:hypothetical protein
VVALRGLAEDATQRYLFRVKIDGSKTEQLPRETTGWHEYDISRCEVGRSHLVELHHAAGSGPGAADDTRRSHADRQRETAEKLAATEAAGIEFIRCRSVAASRSTGGA